MRCWLTGLTQIRTLQVTAEKLGDLKRGTRVTLFLKEDAKELTDDKKLGQLIKQYSEFIQFPIQLWQSKVKSEQVRRSCVVLRSILSLSESLSLTLKLNLCGFTGGCR